MVAESPLGCDSAQAICICGFVWLSTGCGRHFSADLMPGVIRAESRFTSFGAQAAYVAVTNPYDPIFSSVLSHRVEDLI